MRVLFFSERLAPPFDEGIKNVALNLLRRLQRSHTVLALTTGGADVPELSLREIPSVNRLLWDERLRRAARAFGVDRVCYLPTASMTLPAFVRAWTLGQQADAPVTMLALQPRPQKLFHRFIVPFIAPDRLIVQSRTSQQLLGYLGRRVCFAPAGVDMERFAPVSDEHRQALRSQYGIPRQAQVILHVGHINLNRNVQILGCLADGMGRYVVLVGSSSTPQDEQLISELRSKGVHIIREFLSAVEDLYRLADLYVFPAPADAALERTPAIDVPLSVLEAMACDLPVATTRFGGLPSLFDEGNGVIYVDNAHNVREWIDAVDIGIAVGRGHTRRLVEPYAWEHLLEMMLS